MVDSYLTQDDENQFRSLLFQDGLYQNSAIVIKAIISVGIINFGNHTEEWDFKVVLTDNCTIHFFYDDKARAIQDRSKLLLQIEAFYARESK
jgi:hypothetical protein